MTLLSALILAFALLYAGAGGAAVLGRLLRDEPDQDARLDIVLAFALPVGLILFALPGWLVTGIFQWLAAEVVRLVSGKTAIFQFPISGVLAVIPLGAVVIGVLVAFLRRDLVTALAPAGRRALLPPAIFFGVFLFFLWLRLPNGEIRHTEQPMDYAVLSGLMTTPVLPFMDPWMAGETFPYYHFGTLLFALPLRVSGMASEYAYNVMAALLPALAALAAFGVVRARRGGRVLAVVAAFLTVLAGTADGMRQLLGDRPLLSFDFFWESSRRVANAITEWPLFTFRLGDLHPHAVEFPLLITLAGLAGRFETAGGAVLDAILFAAVVSANPWDLPASLLLLAAGNLAQRGFWSAAIRSVSTLGLSLFFLIPFLRSPRPAIHGLFFWPEGTTAVEAFLHFGTALVVPALAVGIALIRSHEKSDEALVAATIFPAVGVAWSILTKKPVFGLACGFVLAVWYLLFRQRPEDRAAVAGPPEGALRAGFLLAGAGAILAAVPDVVIVSDTYGESMRRMNTVFKCFMGAWPLLMIGSALLLPLALSTRAARWPVRILLAITLAAALVHPVAGMVARDWVAIPKTGSTGSSIVARQEPKTMDGLRWMAREAPGDHAAVEWLRKHAPPAAFIAEATGNPYSDYGRIGTASGRPTILGWANHEGLWRANDPDIERRKNDLKILYTSEDVPALVDLVQRRHIRYIVLGPLERKTYGENAFPAQKSFRQVFGESGTTLFEPI